MEPVTVENKREIWDAATSSVAWPAILAGAFAAAAMSLILLLLGSGLGFASVSPWSNSGVTVTTFTVLTAIWLIIMQWVSSGLGGYLTGRLRSRWVSMHTDEVFFRDTAHGFLAWALATIITAAFLASAAAAVIGGGVNAVTAVAASAAVGAGYGASQNSADTLTDPMAYFVDSLYRSNHAGNDPTDALSETTRILINGSESGVLPDTDKTYLVELVSTKTGLTTDEAAQRVDHVLAQIEDTNLKLKEQADHARRSASKVSIFTFLSLLVGAFIACAAAALGGRHRDEY